MRDRLRYGRVRGEEERNFKDSELAMLEEAAAGWAWREWEEKRSWEGYEGPRSYDWFDDCYYIEGEYHEYQEDGPVECKDLAFEAMESNLSKLAAKMERDLKVEVQQYQLRADEILTDWETLEQTMRREHLERLDNAA